MVLHKKRVPAPISMKRCEVWIHRCVRGKGVRLGWRDDADELHAQVRRGIELCLGIADSKHSRGIIIFLRHNGTECIELAGGRCLVAWMSELVTVAGWSRDLFGF
jgi:hypothetical protein